MVTPATFRHPSALAKLVTTADQVSGGRIDVGIGAGWHPREHEAYGFPFGTPRERTDILEEQLAILVGSWGHEPFSFTGEHYRLTELDAQPKPAQGPHPPIILGGKAAKRGAQLAAAYADEPPTGWLVGSVPRVAEQLIDLRDAGVSRVMCAHLVHEDLEAIELIGRELADEIA